MDIENIAVTAGGIVTSGMVSYAIARCVKPSARLKVALDFLDVGIAEMFGQGFSYQKGGEILRDAQVLLLTISTGFVSGVRSCNFHSRFKPCIKVHGFSIAGFSTLNNDRTRFDIPLGLLDENTIIMNLNHIRRCTTAKFSVVGRVKDGYTKDSIEAEFFQGLADGVEVESAGGLIKRLNRLNFKECDQSQVYESLGDEVQFPGFRPRKNPVRDASRCVPTTREDTGKTGTNWRRK